MYLLKARFWCFSYYTITGKDLNIREIVSVAYLAGWNSAVQKMLSDKA